MTIFAFFEILILGFLEAISNCGSSKISADLNTICKIEKFLMTDTS